MSLVPEEQDLTTPTKAPAQAMSMEGMNIDTISSLQADDLQKFIKSLQGLSASSQESTRQPHVHTATTVVEEKIRLEQMETGRPPVSEEPHTRPPPTHNPVSTQTLEIENPQSDPGPPPQVATFAEVCIQQQRTDSLAAYPAIFDLQESNSTKMAERIDILAPLPQHERPSLLVILDEPTCHIRVLW